MVLGGAVLAPMNGGSRMLATDAIPFPTPSVIRFRESGATSTSTGLAFHDQAWPQPTVAGALVSSGVTKEEADRLTQNPVLLACHLNDGDTAKSLLASLDGSAAALRPGDLQLTVPVDTESRIFAVGLNYRRHAEEFGSKEQRSVPIVFMKTWDSVSGPYDPIVLPRQDSAIDFEGELAVVVGHDVPLYGRGGEQCIAGYTVANDVTARTIQASSSQWTLAKSFPTFCPLGPGIVPSGLMPAPLDLKVVTRLNGEIMQEATTGQMIRSAVELVDYVAQHVPLRMGDLLLTGTPEGVGHFRNPPIHLQSGDTVDISIEGIGRISNAVRQSHEP